MSGQCKPNLLLPTLQLIFSHNAFQYHISSYSRMQIKRKANFCCQELHPPFCKSLIWKQFAKRRILSYIEKTFTAKELNCFSFIWREIACGLMMARMIMQNTTFHLISSQLNVHISSRLPLTHSSVQLNEYDNLTMMVGLIYH